MMIKEIYLKDVNSPKRHFESQNFKTRGAKTSITEERNGQIYNRDCNVQLSVTYRMTYKKLFSMHIPDKGLIPRAYKELLQLNYKTKKNFQFKKWAKDLDT